MTFSKATVNKLYVFINKLNRTVNTTNYEECAAKSNQGCLLFNMTNKDVNGAIEIQSTDILVDRDSVYAINYNSVEKIFHISVISSTGE